MSTAQSHFNTANDHFIDEDYETALKHYQLALDSLGDSDDIFKSKILTKRSTCYYKIADYNSAWDDALNAARLDPGNPVAWLRKGMAAFALEEYESALAAFKEGEKGTDDRKFRMWIRKCEAEIDEDESSDDSDSGDIDVMEIDKTVVKEVHEPVETVTNTNIQVTDTPQAPQPQKKYRHSWFQTQDYVSVTIFIKQVREEDLKVEIQPQSLYVAVNLDSGNEYNLDIDLCDEVDPSASSYKILTTKIEIKLMKKVPAHWPELERAEGVAPQSWTSTIDAVSKPTYPSSSKKKRDWDKIAKEADQDEGEKSLNEVFEGIFKGATDEQRMAMQKSFYESGGTVLSTNWEEVGKGTVKGSAPKGMEMRSWKDDKIVG